MSFKLKELKTSKKELREKHDKLEKMDNELTTSYKLLKEEYTNLKINHDNLVISHELLSNEPHDAPNNVVKIDIATSCDDLIVESIEQGSSSKDKKVVMSDNYDDYISSRMRMRSSRRMLKRHQPPTPLSLRILIMIMTWLLK
jgi:predicted nuclease with TOPRIM domain